MFKVLNFIATTFILIGFVILVLIFAPVLQQEANYQVGQLAFKTPEIAETEEEVERLEQENKQNIEYRKKIIIPKNFDFSLVIPKIGVNSQVFANIDSANEDEYLPVLKEGVAHAFGSSLPSQSGSVFIFAHSTDSFFNIGRYNATFFLLRKLEQGNEIYIFYQGKKYTYQVVEKVVVDPEEIGNELRKLEGNFLVLQTCSPPGTTLKRLLVIARLIES